MSSRSSSSLGPDEARGDRRRPVEVEEPRDAAGAVADVGADEGVAGGVAEDVRAVGAGEGDDVARAVVPHEGMAGDEGERPLLGPPLGQEPAQRLGGENVEGPCGLADRHISLEVEARETGHRPEGVPETGPFLLPRHDDREADLGRPFRHEGLRRIEREDGELAPAPAAHQPLLDEAVAGVVAGIALVRQDIEEPTQAEAQFGVDLDPAPVASLVPAVGAPRAAADEAGLETLARRKLHARDRARAGRLEAGLDHRLQAARGDEEPVAEAAVATGEVALPRQQRLQPRALALELLDLVDGDLDDEEEPGLPPQLQRLAGALAHE